MKVKKPNATSDFQSLYPRLLHFGVSYGDLLAVAERAVDWTSWSHQLAKRAAIYERIADEAWDKGRRQSAMEGWCRATDYFHYAQIRLLDADEKQQFQKRSRRNFSRLAPLLVPQARRLEVPFAQTELPGYLRVAEVGAPCLILINGLDSAKEVELSSFGEIFLNRGNSIFVFDGPGQGELNGHVPMPANFGKVVSAVIDCLIKHPAVDPNRLGVLGVSFGGYLACQAGASDVRIRACISLGGFFDSRIFRRLSPLALEMLRRAFGLRPDADLTPLAREITLAPLRGRMNRPLLVVHGRDDHLVDESQITSLAAWALGSKRIWILDGAEHVCTNRFAECLPEVGDWFSEQMSTIESRWSVATLRSYEHTLH